MEDTAVLSAPVDASAPVDTSAAPAAVETPVPQQTDEQILGMDPVGTPPAAKPVEKPVETVQKVADPAAAKTPEAEAAEKIAEDGRLMPVKWREMAKSDPEFRTLFYTAKTNAEKLASIEPQFTEATTKLAAVEKADTAYLSGDPAAIHGELKSFLGEKPAAILPMLSAGENLLKELLPKEYARVSAERLTNSLKEIGMDRGLNVLRQALDAGDAGIEALKGQVAKILEYFDGNGLPTTEQAKLEQQKMQLDAREQSQRDADEQSYVTTSNTFRSDVNKEVETAFVTGIKTAVDKVLEKSAFPDGARARISTDVKAKLYEKLGQNKDVIEQVNRAIWPNGKKDGQGKDVRGRWDEAARKVAVDAPAAYAKTILNDVIKEVVDQYTKDFIATTTNSQTRAAAAASRTEVHGGSNAPRGAKKLTSKDAAGMTDDEILDA